MRGRFVGEWRFPRYGLAPTAVEEPLSRPPQHGPSGMAAIAWAQRAPAGGGQGHSDAPRRRITAGHSALPHSCSDLSLVDKELGRTGRAPICHSRFLKVRNQNLHSSQGCQTLGSAVQAANRHIVKCTPVSASHARSSSALRKVAQLESKIMNRRKQMELQNTSLGQKALNKEPLSSVSSHEHSARGKKYLKNYATASGNMTPSNACSKEKESIQSPKKNVMLKQQLDLDSDEEEMRDLMEVSSGNKNQRVVVNDSKWSGKSKTPVSSRMPPPSHKKISLTEVSKATCFDSTDSEKNVFSRVNSATPSSDSRNLPVQHNVRSQLPSSSMKDNTVKITLPRTGNTKQSQMSLESDRSEIKSLDELFSEAADAEDSTSSSSNNFRLNILSLDDLAPSVTQEAAEIEQKGTDIQITQKSNRNQKKDVFLGEKDQASCKTTSAGTSVNDASEGDVEKTVTEAEISEHLSGVSTDVPKHKEDYLDHDEQTVNSEYSEDFERSLSTTGRKSVSETSEEHSESCMYSGKRRSSALSAPFTRERHDQVQRKTVKETAVQTVDPPFTYCWWSKNFHLRLYSGSATADVPRVLKLNPVLVLKRFHPPDPVTPLNFIPYAADTSAVLDPPVGNSYIDPVPIASHVISMDAVEALTAYNPSVLVLNAMLKQHLMLTQQFVENIHRLHSSLVESLENEKFHYHTLAEAKEYIKNHKSPRLTIEQARQEVWKAQEEKLL